MNWSQLLSLIGIKKHTKDIKEMVQEIDDVLPGFIAFYVEGMYIGWKGFTIGDLQWVDDPHQRQFSLILKGDQKFSSTGKSMTKIIKDFYNHFITNGGKL